MEKTVIARKYELVVIVDAHASSEEKEALRKEAADIVTKAGGKVINSQVWIEKHRMSFPIKKRGDGTYYLINFEAEASAAAKIRTNLKLNEKVLRFEIMRAE